MALAFIDYLDDHAGALTALLTLVLIGVTAYYAWQNRLMVREMEASRRLTVLPRLAIEFHRLGPTAMTVAIKNVGPGAALDIDVRLIYVPRHAGMPDVEQRWRRNVLSSGDQFDFLPPGDTINDNLNTLPATYRTIRLVGSMSDATRHTHGVDESFDDLAAWRAILAEARQRWTAADPERRLAEELYKKFEQPLRDLRRS